MKILVNTSSLQSALTGVGVYTLNICRTLLETSLGHDFLFYYRFASRKLKYSSQSSIQHHSKFLRDKLRRIPLGRRTLSRLMSFYMLRNTDVYFEPNFIPIIDVKARRTITSVHDLSFFNEEWTPKERYDYFRTNFLKEIGKSDLIITPTDFVRQEVLERLGFESGRVVALHYGIDHGVFHEAEVKGSTTGIETSGQRVVKNNSQDGLPERFILFVGSLQPRKNIVSLIKAYAALHKSYKDYCKLVLVGFDGWHTDEIMKIRSSEGNNIIIYDKIRSNESLAAIYQKANAFVFPSLYEGFGFPPLEAMACGCPVMVSNTSSLPEVCGEAALYVDPMDLESIRDGIQKLLTDCALRQELKAKGLQRAKLFTWDKCALQHLKVFENA
jgi:glycosyltransferase involved in cell wall biosynthesis